MRAGDQDLQGLSARSTYDGGHFFARYLLMGYPWAVSEALGADAPGKIVRVLELDKASDESVGQAALCLAGMPIEQRGADAVADAGAIPALCKVMKQRSTAVTVWAAGLNVLCVEIAVHRVSRRGGLMAAGAFPFQVRPGRARARESMPRRGGEAAHRRGAAKPPEPARAGRGAGQPTEGQFLTASTLGQLASGVVFEEPVLSLCWRGGRTRAGWSRSNLRDGCRWIGSHKPGNGLPGGAGREDV